MSASSSPRVLIYVQHLLGVGHLQRALRLGTALRERGFSVEVASGGMPAPSPSPRGLTLRQLPSLYSADGSFTRLLDADGQAIDDDWRARRKRDLLQVFESFDPQVLITETFPFGRRMLRFELLPLLQASRGRCKLVVASIRDILQPRTRPGRDRETCELLDTYYHRVIVHGDETIARLEDSFTLAGRIANKLYYSGYICAHNSPTTTSVDGSGEVLVSAGGSATGRHILAAAIAARPLSELRELGWRLLVSPAIASAQFVELQRRAGDGIVVEPYRPDFSALVQRARLSISQAGYNTMTDILASATPAVVIPYAEANEVEQSLRAAALQRRGRVQVLPESELDAGSLARAMSAALERDTHLEVDLDGAANSAAMIARWLEETEAAA